MFSFNKIKERMSELGTSACDVSFDLKIATWSVYYIMGCGKSTRGITKNVVRVCNSLNLSILDLLSDEDEDAVIQKKIARDAILAENNIKKD